MDIKYSGTVTRGILSAKNRMVEVSVSSNSNDWIMNVMQTDAAINPGNSGGPLCNTNGDVIGVNTLKISVENIEGIGFAVPIEDAMFYANKIVAGEEIKRSYLGVSMADISTSSYNLNKYGISIDSSIKNGVIVMGCDDGTPAYKGGIRKGDVIIMIQEYHVNNIAELRYYLYKYEPKDKVKLKVIRGIEEISLEVELGESEK
jgi:serine protease Do